MNITRFVEAGTLSGAIPSAFWEYRIVFGPFFGLVILMVVISAIRPYAPGQTWLVLALSLPHWFTVGAVGGVWVWAVLALFSMALVGREERYLSAEAQLVG